MPSLISIASFSIFTAMRRGKFQDYVLKFLDTCSQFREGNIIYSSIFPIIWIMFFFLKISLHFRPNSRNPIKGNVKLIGHSLIPLAYSRKGRNSWEKEAVFVLYPFFLLNLLIFSTIFLWIFGEMYELLICYYWV